MKHLPTVIIFTLATILATSLSPAADEKSKDVEQAIQKLEQQWGNALVKKDQATIDRIAAAEWELTDPEGTVVSKAKADADLKSGSVVFESFHLDDLKVRVFGDIAIAYGLETEKSKYQ